MNKEELIQKFVDKQLTKDELKVFKQYFEKPEFARQVQEAIDEKIALKAMAKVSESQENTNETAKPKFPKRIIPYKAVFGIAATIALLILGFWLINKNNNNFQQIANAHSVAPSKNLVLDDKGEIKIEELSFIEEEEVPEFKEAVQYHEERKYGRAIPIFKAILEKNSDATSTRLYLGSALYNEGKYDEALGYFEGVIRARPTPEQTTEAIWGKILILIRQEQKQEAIEYLQLLQDMDKAQQLLKELNQQ